MDCSSVKLTTIDARCDTSMGGIKEILIAKRDDVTMTIDDSDSNSQELITAIKMATGTKFAKWSFRKNTGSYTSTFSSDPAIGNSYFTTEVSLQFSRAEAQKRLDIQTAINANAVVIVRDMYDNYIYLGEDNEVNVTAAVMQSGTAIADLSGFTLTFQDISEEMPHFIKTGNGGVDIEALLEAAAE